MEIEKFKNKYKIKSARKTEWNYANEGFYFVTICIKNMEMLFGNITDEKMNLSEIGKIAENYWQEIPKHFPFIKLDESIVMPNYIHGIIWINHYTRIRIRIRIRRDEALPRLYNNNNNNDNNNKYNKYTGKFPQMSKISPKPGSLSVIIGSFKSISTKTIHQKFPEINFVWQPRFFDRIIRNNSELNRIRQYIIDNPKKWETDRNNLICSYCP